MEDELRLSLLVVGTLIILGVLAHGIWKIRKNNKATPRERVEPGEWESQSSRQEPGFDHDGWDMPEEKAQSQDNFDELGVGRVRVVSASQNSVNSDNADGAERESSSGDDELKKRGTSTEASSDSAGEDVNHEEKLYGSVVTNPKPHMSGNQNASAQHSDSEQSIPEPPGFLLKGTDKTVSAEPAPAPESNDRESFSLDSPDADTKPSQHTSGHTSERLSRKRQHKPFSGAQNADNGDDQMRIEFDEPAAASSDEQPSASRDAEAPQNTNPPSQEVLILNVRAGEGNDISGAALLPLLLTLGFKFGDQDIFHRHVNSNGKGPVLFSLANMFKPGSFDIDNLETFTTRGVSLFMILPIEGDAHQVFNMMHNAARKIADEFGAKVLDGKRSVLTKQGLQQYIEKIREFERRSPRA